MEEKRGVQAAGQQTNPGDEATPGTPGTGEDICRHCNGNGKVDGKTCPECNGTGKVVEGIGGA
jgi:DnaJ-class molecular chaperone